MRKLRHDRVEMALVGPLANSVYQGGSRHICSLSRLNLILGDLALVDIASVRRFRVGQPLARLQRRKVIRSWIERSGRSNLRETIRTPHFGAHSVVDVEQAGGIILLL